MVGLSRANMLFVVVVGIQSYGVIGTAASVGAHVSVRNDDESIQVILIVAILAGIQALAFYRVASESTRRGRWVVASIMIVATFISSLVDLLLHAQVGTYDVSLSNVGVAVIAAIISCGALVWLKRTPSVSG